MPPALWRFGCAETPGAESTSVEVRAPRLRRATGPYVTRGLGDGDVGRTLRACSATCSPSHLTCYLSQTYLSTHSLRSHWLSLLCVLAKSRLRACWTLVAIRGRLKPRLTTPIVKRQKLVDAFDFYMVRKAKTISYVHDTRKRRISYITINIRTFSKLRRVKNYMRAIMKQRRVFTARFTPVAAPGGNRGNIPPKPQKICKGWKAAPASTSNENR